MLPCLLIPGCNGRQLGLDDALLKRMSALGRLADRVLGSDANFWGGATSNTCQPFIGVAHRMCGIVVADALLVCRAAQSGLRCDAVRLCQPDHHGSGCHTAHLHPGGAAGVSHGACHVAWLPCPVLRRSGKDDMQTVSGCCTMCSTGRETHAP